MLWRREELGGCIPKRVVAPVTVSVPESGLYDEFHAGTGETPPVSTTMAMIRLIRKLLKDPEFGPRVVPIVPDEARTFGMEALCREVMIYAALGQKYEPVDSTLRFSYAESEKGQILEEGISEAGSMASFIAAGTSYATLREPMIPDLSLRGMAIMGGIGAVLLLFFLPKTRGEGKRWSFDGRMFFLGAGFMLVETKAVVHMALLFGSTWMVNSVVFFSVLVMILAANLFVALCRPVKLWPYYAGLLATLTLNVVVPLDYFLGMNRTAGGRLSIRSR